MGGDLDDQSDHDEEAPQNIRSSISQDMPQPCLFLALNVIEGDQLVAKDKNLLGQWTTSDPYVLVSLFPMGLKGPELKLGKSQIIRFTLSPKWHEAFEIELPMMSITDDLQFQVTIMDWDEDLIPGMVQSDDDLMGIVPVNVPPNLYTNRNSASQTKWYGVPATSASRACGRIQCTLSVKKSIKKRDEIAKTIVKEPKGKPVLDQAMKVQPSEKEKKKEKKKSKKNKDKKENKRGMFGVLKKSASFAVNRGSSTSGSITPMDAADQPSADLSLLKVTNMTSSRNLMGTSTSASARNLNTNQPGLTRSMSTSGGAMPGLKRTISSSMSMRNFSATRHSTRKISVEPEEDQQVAALTQILDRRNSHRRRDDDDDNPQRASICSTASSAAEGVVRPRRPRGSLVGSALLHAATSVRNSFTRSIDSDEKHPDDDEEEDKLVNECHPPEPEAEDMYGTSVQQIAPPQRGQLRPMTRVSRRNLMRSASVSCRGSRSSNAFLEGSDTSTGLTNSGSSGDLSAASISSRRSNGDLSTSSNRRAGLRSSQSVRGMGGGGRRGGLQSTPSSGSVRNLSSNKIVQATRNSGLLKSKSSQSMRNLNAAGAAGPALPPSRPSWGAPKPAKRNGGMQKSKASQSMRNLTSAPPPSRPSLAKEPNPNPKSPKRSSPEKTNRSKSPLPRSTPGFIGGEEASLEEHAVAPNREPLRPPKRVASPEPPKTPPRKESIGPELDSSNLVEERSKSPSPRSNPQLSTSGHSRAEEGSKRSLSPRPGSSCGSISSQQVKVAPGGALSRSNHGRDQESNMNGQGGTTDDLQSSRSNLRQSDSSGNKRGEADVDPQNAPGFYLDANGLHYYLDKDGVEYYKDPVNGGFYADGLGARGPADVGFYVDADGEEYFLDKRGIEHYMHEDKGRGDIGFFMDTRGREYFLDEDGTEHFKEDALKASPEKMVETGFFLDEEGMEYYLDENGIEYYKNPMDGEYYAHAYQNCQRGKTLRTKDIPAKDKRQLEARRRIRQ